MSACVLHQYSTLNKGNKPPMVGPELEVISHLSTSVVEPATCCGQTENGEMADVSACTGLGSSKYTGASVLGCIQNSHRDEQRELHK